jgi:uncharacterized protein (TIGR03067 family)
MKMAVPAKVAALMKGVMTAMLIAKLKTAVVVVLVLSVLGVAAGVLCRSTPATAQTTAVRGEQAETKTRATAYKSFFGKILAVMSEHFEEITYANQYEGRIEACTIQPDANGLVRRAAVRIAYDDGRFAVDVRVNQLKGTGDKSTNVGRDAALEREIQAKLPKQRNTVGKQEVPTLKREWRVVSVTGGEKAFDVFKHTDLVFLGERLVAIPNDTGPAAVYRVHLGAKRPVQEIDLYHKPTDETRILGVYEVRKNELRICLSNRTGTRPTNVEPSKTQALLLAERIGDTHTLGRRPMSVGEDPIYPMRFLDGGTVPKADD